MHLAKTCHPLLSWTQMTNPGSCRPPCSTPVCTSDVSLPAAQGRRAALAWSGLQGAHQEANDCRIITAAIMKRRGYYFSSLLSLVLAGTKHTSQESLPRSLCWLENDIKPDIELPSAKKKGNQRKEEEEQWRKKKKKSCNMKKIMEALQGEEKGKRKARTNAVTDMQTTHWSTYAIIL